MFGITLIDAGLLPAMMVALFAGVLSFLSPCVLPIVPPYVAYMSGVSLSELSQGTRRYAALLPALSFVLGLSTVFLLLGFTASALGMFFLSTSLSLMKLSVVSIVILFKYGLDNVCSSSSSAVL